VDRVSQSLIVDLLAERPERDLRALREQAVAQRQRIDVEIAQVDEALAKQGRRRGGKSAPRSSSPPGTTRQRVIQALREKGQASPAEIVAHTAQRGQPIRPGSIYNMLKALMEKGTVTRVSEGVYELASANGSHEGEPSPDAPSVESGGMGGNALWPPDDGSGEAPAPNRLDVAT
jgi:hypothetical protein